MRIDRRSFLLFLSLAARASCPTGASRLLVLLGFADWELDGAIAATHDPDTRVVAKALRFLSDRGGPPDRLRDELERNEMLRSIPADASAGEHRV
jgi:hypothetical protein